tara:strand:- start:283 stop:1101 length:819 start_codon:yes stop_codon:yes gene_type:complete
MSTILKRLETELRIKGRSKKTLNIYVTHVREFLDFIKKDAELATEDDIKEFIVYLMDKGNKPMSINLKLSSLRFLHKKILKTAIMNDIENQKVEKKIPIALSSEEVSGILASIKNDRHRLIIELMLSSGMRVSECVSVKINDINLSERIIRVKQGKGNKDRLTILSKSTTRNIYGYLECRKDDNPYLFPSKDGHISVKLPQKIIKEAADRAGVQTNVYCHALRSTFATDLLNSGVDLKMIQDLLGHQSIKTTERYLRVKTSELKKIKHPMDL